MRIRAVSRNSVNEISRIIGEKLFTRKNSGATPEFLALNRYQSYIVEPGGPAFVPQSRDYGVTGARQREWRMEFWR